MTRYRSIVSFVCGSQPSSPLPSSMHKHKRTVLNLLKISLISLRNRSRAADWKKFSNGCFSYRFGFIGFVHTMWIQVEREKSGFTAFMHHPIGANRFYRRRLKHSRGRVNEMRYGWIVRANFLEGFANFDRWPRINARLSYIPSRDAYFIINFVIFFLFFQRFDFNFLEVFMGIDYLGKSLFKLH